MGFNRMIWRSKRIYPIRSAYQTSFTSNISHEMWLNYENTFSTAYVKTNSSFWKNNKTIIIPRRLCTRIRNLLRQLPLQVRQLQMLTCRIFQLWTKSMRISKQQMMRRPRLVAIIILTSSSNSKIHPQQQMDKCLRWLVISGALANAKTSANDWSIT